MNADCHFSIVILANNEEINLERCFASIGWCDDIVLVDSGSTDRTMEIAREHGARVLQHPLRTYADQCNYADDHGAFKHKWVFHLDADEVFTEALRVECEKEIAKDEHSGYYVANRLMLGRKWLKHVSGYPVYQFRFLKLGEVRFVAYGHGHREDCVKRSMGTLKEPYDHYNFSKGLAKWLHRHVDYAQGESEVVGDKFSLKKLLFGNSVERRRNLKAMVMRLPFRPYLRFLYLYVGKLGFLDGRAGFLYSKMVMTYQMMQDVLDAEKKMAHGNSK